MLPNTLKVLVNANKFVSIMTIAGAFPSIISFDHGDELDVSLSRCQRTSAKVRPINSVRWIENNQP